MIITYITIGNIVSIFQVRKLKQEILKQITQSHRARIQWSWHSKSAVPLQICSHNHRFSTACHLVPGYAFTVLCCVSISIKNMKIIMLYNVSSCYIESVNSCNFLLSMWLDQILHHLGKTISMLKKYGST